MRGVVHKIDPRFICLEQTGRAGCVRKFVYGNGVCHVASGELLYFREFDII